MADGTLQDVADRAGVHCSTVALALRDHPQIPAETRGRLRAVAEKLGCRPNPLVAALMRSRRAGKAVKHVTLAFVTHSAARDGRRPVDHDRPDYFPGAVARARDFDHKLECFWPGEAGMTPARFSAILRARGIHGVIGGGLLPARPALEWEWPHFSCVALGMTLRLPLLHHVTENHFATACQAMQRCRERGYRRVGFVVAGANDSPRVGDRWLGAFLAQQPLFPQADRLPSCPAVPADEASFRSWFERVRPDALLANQARPVLARLERRGLPVPRDVGLIDLAGDHPERKCAGVGADPAALRALAIDMLIGLMQRNETGVPRDQHEILLSGEWRDGTTLPPRG